MRTALTVINLPKAGAVLQTEPADLQNWNQFVCGPQEEILCSFFSVEPGATVTIKTAAKAEDDLPVADRVLSLLPGQVQLWLMKNPAVYRQIDGCIHVDFSGVTSVAVYSV